MKKDRKPTKKRLNKNRTINFLAEYRALKLLIFVNS